MYCNKFWLFRLLIKKMEFEIKKEYKSYASGSFFYVDSYQNKLTKSFKSEGMVNTNVINNYIVHPMEIERLIEEFTMKLIEREKKTAFIRIEEPCMYQNVVVSMYAKDDYESGESKIVKFAYTSPTYLVKKLEKNILLKAIIASNKRQAFEYVESGSGWRLITLDHFRSQLLTSVSPSSLTTLKNTIVGSIDGLKKYWMVKAKKQIKLENDLEGINSISYFDPFSKKNFNKLVTFLKEEEKNDFHPTPMNELIGPWCRPKHVFNNMRCYHCQFLDVNLDVLVNVTEVIKNLTEENKVLKMAIDYFKAATLKNYSFIENEYMEPVKNKEIVKTSSIKTVDSKPMGFQDENKSEFINQLCFRLGCDWKKYARTANMEYELIEQIDEDNRKQQDKIAAMLHRLDASFYAYVHILEKIQRFDIIRVVEKYRF